MKKMMLIGALLCAALGAVFAQTTEGEWYDKAGEYFNSGDYANAVTAFSETIKRNSSNLNAYWFRAFAYFQLRNYDAAIADCDTVIKGAPDFSDIYMLRGDAYGAKGVYHTAVADYRTGFEKGYDPGGFNVDKSSRADMWFCGAMYMEITINRFLGKADVVTAYENRLKTVCDKSGVTRAEVEAFYRQNIGALIAGVVDEEFNEDHFGFVAASVYADWKAKSVAGGVDAIALMKETLTNFYIEPTQDNYRKLVGIDARLYKLATEQKDEFARSVSVSFAGILGNLNGELESKSSADIHNKANANYPADSRFDVFSTPYR
jgi:tetratricopeptide (TPR) repeat protein